MPHIGALPLPRSLGEESTFIAPMVRRLRLGTEDRLRIAIVSPEVSAGAGVPHYWLALARTLSQQHEVHVFAAKADTLRINKVKFHRIPTLPLGWFLRHASFYLAARARFLLARLFTRHFDVVLGVGALTPYADVITIHFVQARELELQQRGLIPHGGRMGAFARFDYTLYCRAMAWLGRRFYRRSTASVVAISQSVKHDIVQFEGANPARVSVVPNGVDTERFCPGNRELYRKDTRASLGLGDDEVALLFVGNSWGRKGLQTAIEAISGPHESNVRLLVVGEGDSSAFLSGLSNEVAERIIFVGSRSSDVERLYAAADVFMLPTRYEPFGLVILEALASGLPSIFSACAGASEWLQDSLDGIFLQDATDGREAQAALQSI